MDRTAVDPFLNFRCCKCDNDFGRFRSISDFLRVACNRNYLRRDYRKKTTNKPKVDPFAFTHKWPDEYEQFYIGDSGDSMAKYDVYIDHENSSYSVGEVDLDPQWPFLVFSSLSHSNRIFILKNICNVKHSSRDVPVEEYNISVAINDIQNSAMKDYIVLTLECVESDVYKIVVTGHLKGYSGVTNDKVDFLQIEATLVSLVKLL